MSRRSLRLDDGLLDRSLPHSSASFSVGGASWRSNRSLKSRRSHHLSTSCSESLLLHTPRRAAPPSLLGSSVASDASLLSSLLDESSVQESTLVDTFWGLDQDVDPKESTVVADQGSLVPDARCPKHLVQTLSRVHCDDCEHQSSKFSSSSEPETSTIYCRDRSRKSRTARAGLCGVTDLKESTTTQKELHPDGSLSGQLMASLRTPTGDGCQEERRSSARSSARSSWSSSWSSLASCLLGLMWSAAVLTASCLRQLTRAAASAVWPPTKKMFSASRSAGRSAGGAAGDVFRRLSRRWRHMTSSCLLIGFPLRLLLLLLVLLPLLLFSLCWFGPAVNIPEWGAVVSGFMSFQSRPAEGAVEESREVQPPDSPPPAAGEEEDSVRLVRLEESLAALWEQVEAGGQQAEQRHAEVLQLYDDLQQLVSDQNHIREEAEPWIRDQLDQQLDQQLSRRLDKKDQTSRLDQLEQQLLTLAARTEEAQWRGGAAPTGSPSATLPAAVGGGVDRASHDALRAEISRLEAALEAVRRTVDGLAGCRQLDRLQQTVSAQVSAQVREEVRVLVYGNQLTVGGGAPGGGASGAGLPESLLRWLSLQYVSEAELQVALSSLERSILQNLSQQLEQHRGGAAVREPVLHAAVTPEDVQDLVTSALRRFSEDRTGLADFALESGGGSVLSTRCSETYESKAALLSLFGLPLWFFSQSPRVVIQPDVHPGNCWAFRGSKGFLVIRLSMRILPTAFSLEHIPRNLAPSGTLTSAPRDFTVYGLEDEGQQSGTLLGSFTYDEDGEALQTYRVTEENDAAFQIIEVQVLSNWGHQDYTCLYRFRVHGSPRDA